MIAEITFINLVTLRKSMNYFQNEFANDVSGLCDMGNSCHTEHTCKASLQCELSCDPPGLLCLLNSFHIDGTCKASPRCEFLHDSQGDSCL